MKSKACLFDSKSQKFVSWCVWQVWCDSGHPWLVQRPLEIALTGKMSKRCACFNETDLDQPSLEVYEGCGFLSKACRP
jgi:hypothetical protein